MKKAIQQLMIGPLCKNYKNTLELLKKLKELGFDAIELNSYMIHKTPLFVRILTSLAGMPCGKGGNFNWHKLIKESGLEVSALHTDLDSLTKDTEKIVKEAKEFNTKYIVITGMYNYDYSSIEKLDELVKRLNDVGKKISEEGLMLLYHNHNVEFKRLSNGELIFDYLVKNLNPSYCNFEFDTYWALEAGVNVYSLTKKLGKRMKLHHINDRGFKKNGPYITPILKSDSMELGTGTIDLETLIQNDLDNEVDYCVLETHKNFIDKSRMKSIEVSIDYLNKHIK